MKRPAHRGHEANYALRTPQPTLSASLDCFALSSTAFAAFMASSTLPFSISNLAAWMAASFNFPNSRALFVLRTECWQKRLPLAV
eukprot:CAMPEP_0168483986 /NCGR_PEP_ID=MMETSP0228-20121227/65859_1 /TAXON_ID=133427 /ORGANISM="Protoceratium reticulatum, Strain CCCM 535 (=CCMP 1889)" /LENGTH=84 /DNA_ID=CAMNT_0008500501 /DNA_START=29 /DNA_END=280 /DNA_ORIENTATION=-